MNYCLYWDTDLQKIEKTFWALSHKKIKSKIENPIIIPASPPMSATMLKRNMKYELEILSVKFEDLAGQKLFECSVVEENGQLKLLNNETNLNIV